MSIADQRAMLENYNKVKAEKEAEQAKVRAAKRDAKKKGLNFRPGPAKKPFCAYCKVEGHWLKDKGVVVCVKLVAKQQMAAKRNEKKRESARMWRSQVSEEVSMRRRMGEQEAAVKYAKEKLELCKPRSRNMAKQ